jgi:hypothetical protein
MPRNARLRLCCLTLMLALTPPAGGKRMNPISLHPDNPHYFLFHGKPTVLITSAEHYGAVLNLDFNFVPYLDELHARGFNLTRVFTGAYVEDPTSFGIENNTQAPAEGRFICPWARSATPGYHGGGSKFDLQRWDDAYFRRLKEFCREAGQRGVIVELVLFCPYYEEKQWAISPLNAASNVNGVGEVPREEALTLQHPSLLAAQETMVRKIVSELREFDNLYYEVCNEPFTRAVPMDWEVRIIETIQEAEASFPARHLIAQNVPSSAEHAIEPNPAISIYNLHTPGLPDSVVLNYGLNRLMGFDETGFQGTADLPYRTDGWEFILAGGGVYNHLDYSFSCAHPDGTATFSKSPGGGGPRLRTQLATLKRFIERFDFVRMRPYNTVIKGGVPAGGTARALVEPGKAYAVYLKGGTQANLVLDLPTGRYHAEWLNPRTGAAEKEQDVDHKGGTLTLTSPPYSEDIALGLQSRA